MVQQHNLKQPVHDLVTAARDMLQQLVDSQWSALRGSEVAKPGDGANLIDPEALVLFSAVIISDSGGHLAEHLAWWAEKASWLLSVQRARSMAKTFPQGRRALTVVAAASYHHGGDRRWRDLARGTAGLSASDSSGGPIQLRSSATLILNLRANFGVSVKSDLVAYLTSLQGQAQSAADIAQQVAYSAKTVRLAANELELGGLVECHGDYPTEYSVPYNKALGLVELLLAQDGTLGLPSWAAWAGVYAFLASILELPGRENDDSGLEDVGTRVRGLVSESDKLFRWLQAPLPRPVADSDAEYVSRLGTFVRTLKQSLERTR